MKSLKKTQSGITLIALIITVIILLILAGAAVAISINSGDIFNKTEISRKKTNIESLKESVNIAYLTGNGYGEGETFKEKMEGQLTDVDITEVPGEQGILVIEQNGEKVTVYENGDILEGGIEIWDGSTIECPKFKKENNIWNWYIYKPDQLKFLEVFVNNGNSLTGGTNLTSYVTDAGYSTENVVMTPDTTIYLMNNLDLGARQIDGELTEGTMWTPIGVDSNNVTNKLGRFDGNNYCIMGVYIKRDSANYNGIFGNSNTVQNLTIKDSYVEGKSYTGGIVGNQCGGIINNCHNINTSIIVRSSSGGIVGKTNFSVINCSNSGNLEGQSTLGGIVGMELGDDSGLIKIDGCINYGTINGKSSNLGGIVGTCTYSSVENCINNGMIKHTRGTATTQQDIGGIIGYFSYGNKISRCINNGKVDTDAGIVGGIIGRVLFSTLIQNCYNTESVNGHSSIGGIIGVTYYDGGTIENCYNIGQISGNEDIGGIIGQNSNATTAINSYYLTNTATLDFGNKSESNMSKDKAYLTSDFVTIANQNETIWEVIEGKNNGFPVLINQ